jgi:hypothetical protein
VGVNSDSSTHIRGSNSDSSTHIRGANSDSSSHPRGANSDSSNHPRGVNSDTSSHPRNPNSDASSHPRQNSDTKVPLTNELAQTVYNGYWVETQPGAQGQPGSVTGSSILLSIGNIGTLTAQGGTLQLTGPSTGQYQNALFQQIQNAGQASVKSVSATQGIILFQGTTFN